jgi:acetyltransferase-like isoleucine patch superfamily enzyme
MNLAETAARWTDGELPPNVLCGEGTVITDGGAFRRFRGQRTEAVRLGHHCTMEAVHFAVGEQGELSIGDYCYFTSAILLCELRIDIGSYVSIGWGVTIADSDFHPIDPAARVADAVACSPLGKGLPRPPLVRRPVCVEDYVWIGPGATVLKGVRLGRGCIVEPGAVVTADVPPETRVLGNPAMIIGEV